MEQAVPVLEIGVVLLVAGLVGVLARRLGFPAVVGYLAVGLFVGPFTPGYVADKHQIQVLADIGVVLLLFEVGAELASARSPRSRAASSSRSRCRSRSSPRSAPRS